MNKSQALPSSRPDRRRQILDAALACFTELGLEATTIDMIRARSGASVGSLYHHFRNKEAVASALFVEAMRDHWDRLMAGLEALQKGHASVENGIRVIVQTYATWVEEHPDWARYVFLGRGVVTDPEARETLRRQNGERQRQLQSTFERWQETGGLRDLPNELIHPLIIGPIQDYCRQWLTGRVQAPPSSVTTWLADAAWRSVRA